MKQQFVRRVSALALAGSTELALRLALDVLHSKYNKRSFDLDT